MTRSRVRVSALAQAAEIDARDAVEQSRQELAEASSLLAQAQAEHSTFAAAAAGLDFLVIADDDVVTAVADGPLLTIPAWRCLARRKSIVPVRTCSTDPYGA